MKKTYIGWVGKNFAINDLNNTIYWAVDAYDVKLKTLRLVEGQISKNKGLSDEWHYKAWPPKRITITIELEG